MSCEINFAEKVKIQSTPLNHSTQVCKLSSKRHRINNFSVFAYPWIVSFDGNTITNDTGNPLIGPSSTNHINKSMEKGAARPHLGWL